MKFRFFFFFPGHSESSKDHHVVTQNVVQTQIVSFLKRSIVGSIKDDCLMLILRSCVQVQRPELIK